jgi:hypothetical protein
MVRVDCHNSEGKAAEHTDRMVRTAPLDPSHDVTYMDRTSKQSEKQALLAHPNNLQNGFPHPCCEEMGLHSVFVGTPIQGPHACC